MRWHRKPPHRRGAIAPFAAVLAAFLVGLVAFAVDIGWVVLTRSQLQNAADAAALAGVDPLMDGYLAYHLAPTPEARARILSDAQADARRLAREYAAYNRAGEVTNLHLRDEDIEFGFLDAEGNYSASHSGFPNTIKVVVRRDQNANGSLGLFFGPVLGRNSQDLHAIAAATAMAGKLDSLSVNPPWNVGMLPMTYDQAHWQHFLKTGKDPDGNTSLAGDGMPQLRVYPSIKHPGNFGLLSLNDEHVGNNVLVDWVRNGMSEADLATLEANGLIPLSSHDPKKWDWHGENGFKASLVQSVNHYEGEVFLLPLFKAYSPGPSLSAAPRPLSPQHSGTHVAADPKPSLHGVQLASAGGLGDLGARLLTLSAMGNNGKRKGQLNTEPPPLPPADPLDTGTTPTSTAYQAGVGQGSNFYFNIVEFVGVKIMYSPDKNREVIVQPAVYLEPFGTFTQLQPAGTHATLVTTFATPKLTR